MAVTGKLYGKVFLALWNKEIEWDADTIKVALTTNTYSPAQDTDDYFNDVTNEVTGTGYTAGGATLANKTITYTGGTHKITLDADDVSWTSSTITAANAVIYDASPATTATRPLIAYQNFGGDVSTTSGTLTIVWNASGIVEITVS